MGAKKSFEEYVGSKKLAVKLPILDPTSAMPVKAGRVSVPDDTNVGALIHDLGLSSPDFNIELIGAIETLAKYNGDVSYAVENIVSLGNTVGRFPSNISFDDSIPDALQKEMIKILKDETKDWYAYSGGLNSLVNDLFVQAAVSGAISAEIVPNSRLDGVSKIVMVAPKNIRFRYDNENDTYLPFQQLTQGVMLDGTNLIQLNTATYSYSAMRRFGEKPYGIPPFLSALESIQISRDMLTNLKSVIKRLGVLGFLEVLVNAPKKATQNESDDAYYKRTEKYLSKVVPQIEKGLNAGYVTGFKGMHEFKMHGISGGNVNGARDMVEMNDVKLMAGLKQDPLMFGRNFSTTETLGRVILAKMTTQISNYQQIVENFLEKAFLLHLQLAGYKIENIEIKFDPAMIGDKQREQDTFTKKIENAGALYNSGIISQQQRAVMLGYEKPDQEEPRITGLEGIGSDADNEDPDGNKKTDPNKEDDPTDEKTTGSNNKTTAYLSLGGGLPQYPYSTAGCNCDHESFSKIGDTLNNFITQYGAATKSIYTKAVNKITKLIGQKLSGLGDGAGRDQIYDAIIGTLYTKWSTVFSKPEERVVNKFIDVVYKFYRLDTTPLKGMPDIPDAVFNLTDTRAIEYYRQSDKLYLGKFITDDDLKTKITQYLKDNYLDDDMPIGNNAKALTKFRDEFGSSVLQGQDWKISRIIATTVNRMRNTASVAYMKQAEVTEYEIVGVNDSLQCAYCAALQGFKFNVDKTVGVINSLSSTDPSLVKSDMPFITSVFKKAEDMEGLSATELQNLGIGTPPFHPNCRDRVAAVL